MTFKVKAQGEIIIRRLSASKKIPSGTPLAQENGRFIIGHSETGHHHVLAHSDGATITVLDKVPAGMRILHAILEKPNMLIHERGFDTHAPIDLPPGEYEFRIAREFDPYKELARRSAD